MQERQGVPQSQDGEGGGPMPMGRGGGSPPTQRGSQGVSQGDGEDSRMTAALPADHVDRTDDLRDSLPPARHPALVRGDLHHHGEEGGWGERGPPRASLP